MNIAIIVPTMNRPLFVIRLLEYYKKFNFKGSIHIGDSSNEKNKNILLNKIESLKKNLKIEYQYLPNHNIEITQNILTKKVKEKFVVFSGDDDFFIINSLEKCILFLEENLDYSICHGKSYIFKVIKDKLYDKINYIEKYRMNEISNPDPIIRFKEHINNYWVSIFSVHRTAEYLDDLSYMDKIKIESFREQLLSLLPIIRGKSKTLNCDYLFRQVHNQRYANPNLSKLVLDPDFSNSYLNIKKILSNLLNKKSKKEENFFEQIIEDAYANKIFAPKHNNNFKRKSIMVNIKMFINSFFNNYFSNRKIKNFFSKDVQLNLFYQFLSTGEK
tara:strand:- start:206 stop:1195 length:990 start_codon:yes stop_codon:yes gene_type:complete